MCENTGAGGEHGGRETSDEGCLRRWLTFYKFVKITKSPTEVAVMLMKSYQVWE